MSAFIEVSYMMLDFYVWILIISAALSWLVAFNIINTHNRLVRIIGDFTYRLTEPLLRPIRRILPPFGGVDLSTLALIFIIMFLQSFLRHLMI
ncbi:MAG: YggT family protein [Alphaproteobacteria bacterium]|nr:YggT family protein [Alphaproteobacteria bacterium]MBV8549080.1 YggT family protein [Alphaproteobacteria bacterium]